MAITQDWDATKLGIGREEAELIKQMIRQLPKECQQSIYQWLYDSLDCRIFKG
jgi:hypothetical protein